MNTLSKLLDLLTPKERKRGRFLLVMILIMALLDMIGVASIMPFMAVLANPEVVNTNTILNAAYKKLDFTDSQQFLFYLGVFVFILLVVSLMFRALTNYTQLRFAMMGEYVISKRLFEGYLRQPYSWFLNRHSANLGKIILSDVSKVINQVAMPMITLIAQVMVSVGLLTLLILIDPKLALIVGLTLTIAYIFVFKVTRGLLSRIGLEQAKANQDRFIAVSEVFGAPKEVKVGGLEQAYIQRFSIATLSYVRLEANAQIISQLPRFALEAIAFGGMLLVILYQMAKTGGFDSSLPTIALYAFAGYRLMPALQQIYGAVTLLRFATPALNSLHTDLMGLESSFLNSTQTSTSISTCDILPYSQAITLNNIQYRYPNAQQPTLKNLNLSIASNSTVGLVGSTGSGKTTTVDLILGLLDAQEGSLEVDGKAITDCNKRVWQRKIGYVPQQIYLIDDTVSANIAFGLDAKDIDQVAVERAAKIANVHDFVVNELPQNYQTILGERGVRLSGGQRQRIGIARALYGNPQVLILDEATSALDNLTEQVVMEAVHNLTHEITIILIAHRLSTVKMCDTIFLLDKGELVAEGTFDELIKRSKLFQKMASKNE